MLEEYGRNHPNTYELLEEGNIRVLVDFVLKFSDNYPESNLYPMLSSLWDSLLYDKM